MDTMRNNEEQIKALFKDKLLVRQNGEVSTRTDIKTFSQVSTMNIEFSMETIYEYRRIFGEEELYKEIGRLLFGK